jgi:hypothetical protein
MELYDTMIKKMVFMVHCLNHLCILDIDLIVCAFMYNLIYVCVCARACVYIYLQNINEQ